jgi:glycerol kinase
MLEMTSLVGVNIAGCMGDEQAALVVHCCTSPGMSKVTIGTGCFLLTNVGVRPIMISTVAVKLAGGPTFFGLEGSVG